MKEEFFQGLNTAGGWKNIGHIEISDPQNQAVTDDFAVMSCAQSYLPDVIAPLTHLTAYVFRFPDQDDRKFSKQCQVLIDLLEDDTGLIDNLQYSDEELRDSWDHYGGGPPWYQ